MDNNTNQPASPQEEIKDGSAEAASPSPSGSPERPRVMWTKSGRAFAPGWTWNDLIDARHLRDLTMDGCTPALAEPGEYRRVAQ